jgi:hypothetical protein
MKLLAVIVISFISANAWAAKSGLPESEIQSALDADLAKVGNVCLNLHSWYVKGTSSSSVTVSQGQQDTAEQMDALVSAGLISFVKDDQQSASVDDTSIKRGRYIVTDLGRPYYRTVPNTSLSKDVQEKTVLGDFCFGKITLKKIISWRTLASDNGNKVVEVKYQYWVDDLPKWTKNADVVKNFPQIQNVTSNAGLPTGVATLVQIGRQWKVMNSGS